MNNIDHSFSNVNSCHSTMYASVMAAVLLLYMFLVLPCLIITMSSKVALLLCKYKLMGQTVVISKNIHLPNWEHCKLTYASNFLTVVNWRKKKSIKCTAFTNFGNIFNCMQLFLWQGHMLYNDLCIKLRFLKLCEMFIRVCL